MDQGARIQPSLWHVLWGLPFLLIGCGIFGYTLFHGLFHLTDLLTQVVVPGQAELNLRRDTTYTVFLEKQSVINGRIYSTTQPVDGLACRVTSLQGGAAIPVTTPGSAASYDVNGRSGESVLEFHTPADGKYLFACDYGPGSSGPEAVLAVGAGVGESIYRTVFVSLASIFGSAIACIIVVLVVITWRDHNKKKIWQSGHAPV